MTKEQRLDSVLEFFHRVLGFKAKYENDLAMKEKKTMTPVIIEWVVPRNKEMALENLIMDWFFTKDYTTGPEAFAMVVKISEKDNPSFNRCIIEVNLRFENDVSADTKRQIVLSMREFIRRNFDFSDNSSGKDVQHTSCQNVQPTIDDDKEEREINVVEKKSHDKTYDEVLSELDRHYESIGGTCSYDENGHVCWNSKVGCCGSATMIPR